MHIYFFFLVLQKKNASRAACYSASTNKRACHLARTVTLIKQFQQNLDQTECYETKQN